jgi:16S rRNA (adenine(1408)-N(1))-methyltransferase
VRQVVGKTVRDLDATSFAAVRAGYRDLVVDLGTGDGKHVTSLARQRSDALVVGVDAGPDAMRTTAQRAARKPAKGGVPNALFVWAAVEDFPPELTRITEVHVLMPWGSLLRALIAPDTAVLRAVAERCVAGATLLITMNLHAWRPPVPEVGSTPEPTPETVLDDLAVHYAGAGWRLDAAWYLSDAEIAALGTSWTKRLGSSRTELAVLGLRGRVG